MMRLKNILFLLAAAVVSVTACNEVEPEPELPEVEWLPTSRILMLIRRFPSEVPQ